jgi:hypothetical protein
VIMLLGKKENRRQAKSRKNQTFLHRQLPLCNKPSKPETNAKVTFERQKKNFTAPCGLV